MSSVDFTVLCSATYKGHLDLPKNVNAKDRKAVLAYIHENLGEVPATDMTWLNDAEPCEAVTEEDIISITED